MKEAPLKKSIHSLPVLRELMEAANSRYLEFVSTIEDPMVGIKNLEDISEPTTDGQHTYRGSNLFRKEDLKLFEGIARGEFHIHGFQKRLPLDHPALKSGSQVSRMFKRLRMDGMIKKILGT